MALDRTEVLLRSVLRKLRNSTDMTTGNRKVCDCWTRSNNRRCYYPDHKDRTGRYYLLSHISLWPCSAGRDQSPPLYKSYLETALSTLLQSASEMSLCLCIETSTSLSEWNPSLSPVGLQCFLSGRFESRSSSRRHFALKPVWCSPVWPFVFHREPNNIWLSNPQRKCNGGISVYRLH